ncbi:putative inner membrane transporter yiJE [Bacillus sp. THAF10]|uniref:DMT family transporter n=1 Tax=Bacillus sp. THAF10 TaxID=2587848 RepID=UPI001267FB77|nr:DMT family transporter [Bacillus sp. THAF10]QFT88698.1 putative inner membrane transporter yiJE [Bacillus sp. THAF10]
MKRLYLALLTLSLIWGMSFFFIKILVTDLGVLGVVFWRCVFGAGTLFVLLLIQQKMKVIKKLPIVPILLIAILNNALPWALIAISETSISSSMASVVNATTPIWTILIGFSIFSSKMRTMQWIGVLVGFIGILVLLKLNIIQLFQDNFFGVGTMLGATICYGFGAHLSRRYLQDIPITIISFSTLAMAGILSGIFMLVLAPEGFLAVTTASTIFSLIGLGVFGSGIAYLLYYYMVKEGSAEFASLVTYIVPLTAMGWGSLLLNEEITPHMLIGLILIFSGVYLSSYKTKAKKQKPVNKIAV